MISNKHRTRASEVTQYAVPLAQSGALTAQRLAAVAGWDPDLLRELAADWAIGADIAPHLKVMSRVAGEALGLALDRQYG